MARKDYRPNIEVPYPAPGSKGVYLKHAVRGAMDIAMVGVAVMITPDAAKANLQDVRIGLGAVAPTPLRAPKAEALLRGKPLTAALVKEAAAMAASEASPISDQRSSAENRRWIVEALTRKGLEQTWTAYRQGGSIMSLTISTKINGQPVSASAEALTLLLEFLRDTLEFKGTKLCSSTGECGACTIIYNGKPINSCVTMAADAIGAEILTIEGFADGDKLHPVQQAFIDTGVAQCGYCTPGFIMSVKVLLDRTTKPTAEDIEEAVSGNICRCTGYNKIVDAIQLAAESILRQGLSHGKTGIQICR